MKVNASLRTRDSELAYAGAEKGDIKKLRAANIGGMKVLENGFPYDAFYNRNEMLLANDEDNFLSWWMKLGVMIEDGRLGGFDQLIYNFPHRQSQPHVAHCHLVNFKERDDFKL